MKLSIYAIVLSLLLAACGRALPKKTSTTATAAATPIETQTNPSGTPTFPNSVSPVTTGGTTSQNPVTTGGNPVPSSGPAVSPASFPGGHGEGIVVTVNASTYGLMAFGKGILGKLINPTTVRCVERRAPLYGSPSDNWWPMHSAQGGHEIIYFPRGNKLVLNTSGELSIGPRTGAGIFLEVLDYTGRQVLSSELLSIGTTGSAGHSSTFSKTDHILPVLPNTPYLIRTGLYVATADDQACPQGTPNYNVSVKPIKLTLEDYHL